MGVSNHQLGLVISAALIGTALGRFSPATLADWLGRKENHHQRRFSSSVSGPSPP
ncbi:hypothetical protein MJ579_06665 [Klebsiella pneumoniae]|nr:hypothetical protein MJ579_06665 [Klebsiella pneumoniae]